VAQAACFEPGEDEVAQRFPAFGSVAIDERIGEHLRAVEDARPRRLAIMPLLGGHRSSATEARELVRGRDDRGGRPGPRLVRDADGEAPPRAKCEYPCA